MALDIPLPWLRAPDTLGALSAGSSAGLGAARNAAAQEESAARLAADAIQHNERNKFEAARLDQAERLSAMENETRKEIAEQNRLRESQRMAIREAYQTAQIGLAKGRLEEQQAIADAKAKDAALRLQREAQFSAAVAGGTPVMQALQQYPVPASVINAVVQTQHREQPQVRSGNVPLVQVNPDGSVNTIYTPPASAKVGKLSDSDKEDLKDLRAERKQLDAKYGSPFMQRVSPAKPEEMQQYKQRIAEIDRQIQSIKRPTGIPGETQPLPKESKDLQTGTKYQTRHGVAVWDGKQFQRVLENNAAAADISEGTDDAER